MKEIIREVIKINDKAEKIINDAKEKAQKIITEAQKTAQNIKEEARVKAQNEIDTQKEKSEQNINAQTHSQNINRQKKISDFENEFKKNEENWVNSIVKEVTENV